jgi:hypothetical protein
MSSNRFGTSCPKTWDIPKLGTGCPSDCIPCVDYCYVIGLCFFCYLMTKVGASHLGLFSDWLKCFYLDDIFRRCRIYRHLCRKDKLTKSNSRQSVRQTLIAYFTQRYRQFERQNGGFMRLNAATLNEDKTTESRM